MFDCDALAGVSTENNMFCLKFVAEDLRTGHYLTILAHRISEGLEYIRTTRNLLMLLPRLCKNIMLQNRVTEELSCLDLMQDQGGNELKDKEVTKQN